MTASKAEGTPLVTMSACAACEREGEKKEGRGSRATWQCEFTAELNVSQLPVHAYGHACCPAREPSDTQKRPIERSGTEIALQVTFHVSRSSCAIWHPQYLVGQRRHLVFFALCALGRGVSVVANVCHISPARYLTMTRISPLRRSVSSVFCGKGVLSIGLF